MSLNKVGGKRLKISEENLGSSQSQLKSPAGNQLDEKSIKYIYDRYLQLLQEDKNATIQQVLVEEPFKRQFSGSKLDEKEIEAAVMERMFAEEENLEI